MAQKTVIPPLGGPKIALIFDTNFLYSTDERSFTGLEYEKTFDRFKKAASLSVFLPKTVVDERTQHVFDASLKVLNTVVNDVRRLRDFTTLSILDAFPDANAVRAGVNNRKDEWLKKDVITVWATPFEQMKLEAIVEMAVTKSGLFQTTRKGKEKEVSEKGFKDYLILRTIEASIQSLKGFEKVVVGTADGLLGDEVKKITGDVAFEIAEDWSRLHEIIATLVAKLNDEQINALRPLFAAAFEKNVYGGASKEIIRRLVAEDFSRGENTLGLFLTSTAMQSAYSPSVKASDTTLVEAAGKLFTWKSVVQVDKTPMPPTLSTLSMIQPVEESFFFDCLWQGTLNDEKQVRDTKLVSITKQETESKAAQLIRKISAIGENPWSLK